MKAEGKMKKKKGKGLEFGQRGDILWGDEGKRPGMRRCRRSTETERSREGLRKRRVAEMIRNGR
jgi:hypothetical protein